MYDDKTYADDKSFADAFFWALDYNGYNQYTERLADILDSPEGFLGDATGYLLIIEDWQRAEIGYKQDNMMQMLWMILVQLFGDYGCSPRTGWIEDIAGASKFVRQHIERTWNYEEDE